MVFARALHRYGNRRRAVAGVLAVSVSFLVSGLLTPTVGSAASPSVLRSVSVQIGPGGEIRQVVNASVTKDADGTVTNNATEIAPQEAVSQLPIRLQTAWWSDGKAGTDLSALKGKTGRVTIQLSVQNLTAEPTLVSFESNGQKYSQRALVYVPLTVVATTNLGKIPYGDIVRTAEDSATPGQNMITDGMITTTDQGDTVIQWARLLAPPTLSASATFTVVLDVKDFQPPQFDVSVQPGLITDPSVQGLVSRSMSPDGEQAKLEASTISMVAGVSQQLTDAQNFITLVHQALQGDVTQISASLATELKSNSDSVLSNVQSTSQAMDSIRQSVTGGVTSTYSQTQTGVNSLVNSLQAMLGSDKIVPKTVDSHIDGCSVTLPTLDAAEPSTVSSSIYLISAQMQTLVDAFASGVTTNCRAALVSAIDSSIGDPSSLTIGSQQAADCEATAPQEQTIACALFVTSNTYTNDIVPLLAATTGSATAQGQVGAADMMAALNGLVGQLTTLRSQTLALKTSSGLVKADLETWVTDTNSYISAAQSKLTSVAAALSVISGQSAMIRNSIVDIQGWASDVSSDLSAIQADVDSVPTPTIGEWFLASGYPELLASACPSSWVPPTDPDPTVDSIDSALISAGPLCPVASTVRTTVADMNNRLLKMSDIQTHVTDAVGNVGNIVDTVSSTGPIVTSLSTIDQQITDPDLGLNAQLSDVSVQLGDIQTQVNQIDADVRAGGSIATLSDDIDAVNALIQAMWPQTGEPTVISDSADCPSSLPPVAPSSTLTQGEKTVYLANRLYCANVQLSAALSTLHDELASSTTQTQAAHDQSITELGNFSDQLAASLAAQQLAAQSSLLTTLNMTKQQVTDTAKKVLDEFGLSTNQVILSLTSAIDSQQITSAQVSQMLSADFAKLMTNLGSSDPNSRSGLLGKLVTISGQVGDAGRVLTTTTTSVTSFSNTRAVEARLLNLQATQFDLMQQRIASYQPFSNNEGDEQVVFVFRVSGQA